jgi:hypothetical protein
LFFSQAEKKNPYFVYFRKKIFFFQKTGGLFFKTQRLLATAHNFNSQYLIKMAARDLAASPSPAPLHSNDVIYVRGTHSPTTVSEPIYVRGSQSPMDKINTTSPSPPPKRKRTPSSPAFIPSTFSPAPIDGTNRALTCEETLTADPAAEEASMPPANTLMDTRCSVALSKDQQFTATLRTLQMPQSSPPPYSASSESFLPPHTPSPTKSFFTGASPSKSPPLINDLTPDAPFIPIPILNLCTECGVNMGPDNSRQLCGKTKCDNLFMSPPPHIPKKVRFSD